MTEPTTFKEFSAICRPALREILEETVDLSSTHGTSGLQDMVSYQLGWSGEGAGPKAEGKQIRPLLVLLACQAAGGDWKTALPAAGAVELIHNFSLIHDDIEDRGEIRRGRPALWTIWGEAQAINTGDAMFALANICLLGLEHTSSLEICLEVSRIFHSTCLHLTQGQHLDISFEDLELIEMESYWRMVEGKTAALLSFCLEAGALCAGAVDPVRSHYRDFGRYLGLAFQVQDDLLGIWGAEDQTGKSATSDLETGKKTLPVLYGLAQQKDFYRGWMEGSINPKKASALAQILEAEGGRAYAQNTADRLTDLALGALKQAQAVGPAADILPALAQQMLRRQS